MFKVKAFIAIVLAILLAACATTGQDSLIDSDLLARDRALEYSAPPGYATVFLMRERALLQPLLLTPIPPAFLAVNGRLVTSAPVGTFYPIALPPGEHTITRVVVVRDVPFTWYTIGRKDSTFTLEAGRRYYIASVNTLSDNPIRQLSETEARAQLKSMHLAKEIVNGKTTDAFISQFETADQRLENNQRRAAIAAPNALNATSQSGTSGWLEGLAVVLLVALAIAGGSGAAGAAAPPSYTPPVAIYAPHSTARDQARPATVLPQLRLPSSAGDVIWSGQRAELRNRATGVRYTVEDGRVNGTDGSRFRVIGSQLLSESGQWYQIIGNTLYSAAGPQCRISDDSINCRSR